MLPPFSRSLIRMIVQSRTPTEYRDTFLKNAAQAFRKRRKAINFHGNLEFSYDFEDSFG
jgi:hypothetical protein